MWVTPGRPVCKDPERPAESVGPVPPQRGLPMRRSSGRDRRARRFALEQCEDRILQSITVEPVGDKATQPQQTAYTPDASRIAVFYNTTLERAPGIFDDPFFFDAN